MDNPVFWTIAVVFGVMCLGALIDTLTKDAPPKYEKPEDRPKPVTPPKPNYICTNCGRWDTMSAGELFCVVFIASLLAGMITSK